MKEETKLTSIHKLVTENLTFYDAPINEIKIKMFAQELFDLDLQDLHRVFAEFRQEKGRKTMPMPSDVRDKINPVENDQTLALEAAARIASGISKFGYTQPEDAKNYIGPVGWMVVEKLGGWSLICQTQRTDDMKIFYAQCRDLAKAQIELARAGRLHIPPQLPGRVQRKELAGPKPEGTPAQNNVGPKFIDSFAKLADILPRKDLE